MEETQAEVQQEVTQEPAQQPQEQVQQEAPKQDTSWIPKRISEISALRRAAEERAAAAEAELARLRAQQPVPNDVEQPHNVAQSPQSVEQLARAYAEKLVRDQREQETLTSRIAEINAAGTKEFGEDFERSVQNLNMAGVGGMEFLRVITNIPNAEKVVTWLGKSENLNEALRISTMDPVQMGIELTKMSATATKALTKQLSKAPPPISPIDGSSKSDGAEPAIGSPEWFKWRNETARRKR
jgi:hypothetical protein